LSVAQVLLMSYMLLLAYASLFEGESIVTVILYVLTILPLLVAVEIANTLSSPFGKDVVDFNLDALLESVFEDCQASAFASVPEFYDMIGTREWCPSTISDRQSHAHSPCPSSDAASQSGSSVPGRRGVSPGSRPKSTLPTLADGSIDVRKVLAQYERRRSTRIQREQKWEDEAQGAGRTTMCEALLGPCLGPFRDEHNPGWYKSKKEVRDNIVASVRGQWRRHPELQRPPGAAGASSGAEQGWAAGVFESNEGMATLFEVAVEEYLEGLVAEDAASEDSASISTTGSVRRLNAAISDLGFHMQSEVEHVSSIARFLCPQARLKITPFSLPHLPSPLSLSHCWTLLTFPPRTCQRLPWPHHGSHDAESTDRPL